MKKFCNILLYLQRNDDELYQAILNCCGFPSFSGKGLNGVTFLRPAPGSKLRAEFLDAIYGDEPEQGAEMLQALIVLESLPGLGAFKKGAKLANRLRQGLEVKAASSSEVKIDGLTLKVDPDFKSFEGKSNNVFLADGKVSTDNDKAEPSKKMKKGGFIGGGSHSRLAQLHKLLRKYAKKAALDRGDKRRCLFLEKSVAMLNFLEARGRLEAFLPKLDWCPVVNYYLLMCPYGGTSPIADHELCEVKKYCTKFGNKKRMELLMARAAAGKDYKPCDATTVLSSNGNKVVTGLNDQYKAKGGNLLCDELRMVLGSFAEDLHAGDMSALGRIDDYAMTVGGTATFGNPANFNKKDVHINVLCSGPLRLLRSNDCCYLPQLDPPPYKLDDEDVMAAKLPLISTVGLRKALFQDMHERSAQLSDDARAQVIALAGDRGANVNEILAALGAA